MKVKKIANFVLSISVLTASVGAITGCEKEDAYKIILNSEASGIIELQQGEKYVLLVTRDDKKTGSVFSYVIDEGKEYVSITTDGVLVVNKNATVGETIKVRATSGNVSSNVLTFKVVEKKTIVLSTNIEKLDVVKNQSITLNTKYLDSDINVSGVTYKITQGASQASINNNILTINKDALEGSSITVIAETDITTSNTLTFNVVGEVKRDSYTIISSLNDNIVDATKLSATRIISFQIFDMKTSSEINVSLDDCEFEVIEGEDIISISKDGAITPLGNGSAVVRVKYVNPNDSEKFAHKNITVTSIVTPEVLNLSPVLENVKRGVISHFGFGINEKNNDGASLDLGITGSHTLTEKFASTYKITTYIDGATESSEGYATFSNETGKITFTEKAIGHKLRVVVSTDSNAYRETKTEFTVEVNNGVNIYNQEQLFGENKYGKNITINLLSNIEVVGDSNTITNRYKTLSNIEKIETGLKYYTLNYFGDVNFYGNGHSIDMSKVVNKYSGGGNPLIEINNSYPDGAKNNVNERDSQVRIYDLDLKSNNSYNGEYSNNVAPVEGSFDQAIVIRGAYQDQVYNYKYENGKKRYTTFVDINNLNISGFQTGMRFEFVNSIYGGGLVDGRISSVSNVNIFDCMESGIETAASIMNFENIGLDRFGTTAIELTPDKWWMAGSNFDTAQHIVFKGVFESQNYNAFNNNFANNNEDIKMLSQLINSVAAQYSKDSVGYDFYKFLITQLNEGGSENKALNLVSLLFNNFKVFNSNNLNSYKEAYNGSIVEFEDMNGTAIDYAKALTTLLEGSEEEKENTYRELVNSKYVKLEIQTNSFGTYSEYPENIDPEEKAYLNSKGVIPGNDIYLGTVLVENPLYNYKDQLLSEDPAIVGLPKINDIEPTVNLESN